MASSRARANIILGLLCVIFALFIAFIWVPMDSGTGMIERARRQITIGDALAPTIAAAFLLLGGLLVALLEPASQARRLSARNLLFLASLFSLLLLSLMLMRWLGPALAALFTEEGYRPLRDTAPWKYIGFLAGGTGLIAGLIGLVEGRFSWHGLVVGLMASLLLILIYDLPFDDLLLPPNGDV